MGGRRSARRVWRQRVNLGGTLSAHLIMDSRQPSEQLKVMDYSSISGAFAALTGDGFTFDACYTPNALFVCNVQRRSSRRPSPGQPQISSWDGTHRHAVNATASVPGDFAYTPAAGTIRTPETISCCSEVTRPTPRTTTRRRQARHQRGPRDPNDHVGESAPIPHGALEPN